MAATSEKKGGTYGRPPARGAAGAAALAGRGAVPGRGGCSERRATSRGGTRVARRKLWGCRCRTSAASGGRHALGAQEPHVAGPLSEYMCKAGVGPELLAGIPSPEKPGSSPLRRGVPLAATHAARDVKPGSWEALPSSASARWRDAHTGST